MASYIYAGLFALTFILIYRLSRIGRRPANFPPGPPTLPLIGNLHLMPKEKAHLQFQIWAEEYGPVYSLTLGTKVMVVLNTDQAVKDLLDKRSGIYSSRPDMYISRIAGGGMRFSLMEYGERWRMIHKIVHKTLNINAAKAYVPYQDLENKAMLVRFLERPEEFIDSVRLYANSLTTQMIFGYRTTSTEDPRFKQFFHGFEKLSILLTTHTAAFLDLYPMLRNLPDLFLPLRRYAKRHHEEESKLYVGHWLDAKNRIERGISQPSFCVDLMRTQKEEGFSDLLAGYSSGVLLEAGSDTTSSILVGFMQAMVLFPEVAKTAQAEIDRVCGSRLPTFDDDLPYIRACIKESMRWMPTAILGIPHAVMRDDEYMGYRIPKNATLMLNVWAIHNDARKYPNPRAFDPTRYLNDTQTAIESANSPDPSMRDHFLFGAGRRFCQGSHIAERSLFLGYSRLLWAFDFKKALHEDGALITPDATELTEGLLVQPKPFPARIEPRSSEKVETVRREWEMMEELLDQNGQWKVLPEGPPLSGQKVFR
ncbi:hypothetical protein SLS61_007787 [Didymella pomorum]